MLMKNTLSLTLYSMMLFGTYLAISSKSWFGAWVGMELNLISFIPIMSASMKKLDVEASFKYYLIQACGSLILLFSSVVLSTWVEGSYLMMTFALMLKVGMAPFHFWMPMIAESLSWLTFFLMLTLQKLAPLTLLNNIYVSWNPSYWWVFIISSGIVGALGGVNEMYLRKLLSFSSISHLGWMVMSFEVGGLIWLVYFFMYAYILAGITYSLSEFQIMRVEQMIMSTKSYLGGITLFVSFMSIGGLPPFLGFLPKMIVVNYLMFSSSSVLIIIMMMLSMVTLYYYLRVSLSMLLTSETLKNNKMKTFSSTTISFMGINMTGIMLMGVFIK